MYTYARPFIGVPLSQLKINTDLTLLGEIAQESDMTVASALHIRDLCRDELSAESQRLLTFIDSIQSDIAALNQQYDIDLNFHHSYHGSDDMPVIFGAYVDKWLNIPDMGCQRVDMSCYNTMLACLRDVQALFAGYDGTFPVDFYINNHSS